MKRGKGCRMVEELRLYTLWKEVKTWTGGRAISPVMLVGNCARLEEEDRSAESED